MKSWPIGKDLDARKDWGQEEKGATEGKMVGWHHWLNGHEFEQIPGDSEGQGSLVDCHSWGCKESDKQSEDIISLTPGLFSHLQRISYLLCRLSGSVSYSF